MTDKKNLSPLKLIDNARIRTQLILETIFDRKLSASTKLIRLDMLLPGVRYRQKRRHKRYEKQIEQFLNEVFKDNKY